MKSASLNHIYRLVWNEATNTYVAVAEHIAGRGKRTSGVAGVVVAASLALFAGGAAHAQALPTGAAIAAGAAAIAQSGNQMTVTQATQRLVTNWNTFDVGTGAAVRFVQPNASAIALNRVTGGGAASAIDGSLSANGNVWLLNPNGVVFGSGARVDVGGLVASSLGLSDGDFLAGRTRLTGGAGAGAVVNHGTIRTASGGVVALVAPRVANTGSIATPGGSTALAAGETVSLDFQGDGLVSVRVERGVAEAAVENSGRIAAEGGLVTLSARGADAVLGSVVNHTGVIEAHGLVARDGRILLDGDAANGGTTHVAGTLDAASAVGRGGAIVVTGKTIALDGGAVLDASGASGGGTVNVGGGWQGKDAAIANATTVTADASVTARANATSSGDGGQVVFWSDDTTRFAGRIDVRGGALGGDGGKAEVSGKQTLVYDGVTDARATRGTTGDLLLDPTNITVEGGGGTSGTFTGTAAGDVTVYERTLEAQTANVLMQATNAITFNDLTGNGGDGVITMQPNVSFRAEVVNSGNTVTLINFVKKDNGIVVSGTGSIYIQAGGGNTGSITNVFNLTALGAGDNPAVANLPDHTVSTIGSGTPGAGTITLLGADGLTIAGALRTNGGYVRVSGDSDSGGQGNFNLATPVSTGGGNLYVSFGRATTYNSVATLAGDIMLGTGRLVFGDAMGNKALGASTGEKVLAGRLTLNGNVDFSTPLTMRGGASIYTDGAIRFLSNVKLDTGTSALTLRAADVDFSGATLANVSTASLVLEPYDIATNINLNGATTGIARASTFAQLAGIRNLTIGRADGTGTTTVPTGGFAFNASNTLKLLNGTVEVDGALRNTNPGGRIVAQAGQDVVLGTSGSVAAQGSGDAVVLAAGRNFTNGNASGTAISAANGRWLVYSTTPASDTRGNLANAFKQYDINYGGTAATDTVLGTGNGFLYRVAPVVNVSLTGEVRKVYDGATGATATDANLTNTGAIDGDTTTFRLGSGSTASYMTKVAGAGKNVDVSGVVLDTSTQGAVQVYGYRWNTVASGAVGIVEQRSLAINPGSNGISATVADKVYDGGTGASVTGVSIANVAQGDVVSATGTGTFADRNVGTGKTVTVGNIQLSGADAANYVLAPSATANASADITAKTLTATAGVTDKVYDGNTAATVAGVTLVGVVAGDQNVVGTSGTTGTFADKNVGTGKAVSGSGIVLTGSGAANYVFDTAAQIGTAAITPKALTATATATDKVYDGGTTAALSGVTLVGVVAGDQNAVGATGATGSFADRNVGAGKVVSGSGITLSGSGAGNYVFDTAAQIGTAAITPKALSATAIVTDKVYDGNTAAALSSIALSGVVAGDQNVVGASGSGRFADKDVDTGKAVTAGGLALTGSGAGNYTLDTTAQIGTAAITPKALTATASVADKVYDGNTSAALNGVALVGVVAGEQGLVGTTGATGSFADRNAGTGKVVSGSGIALSGSGAANYVFDTAAQIGTAAITPKALSATASVADKVYDGGTTAALSGIALVGVVTGDQNAVGATGATGSFADRNAGTGKAVAGSGIALTGSGAGNYVFDTAAQIGTAAITPKALTATASVADKVYDGSTAASLGSIALVGVVAGDQNAVGTTGATGSFVDRNAGTGKAVTASGVALMGSGAGNYSFDAASQIGTAAITPKALSATASVADKVYDGSTAAALSGVTLVGVVAGDQNAVGATGATGSFADRNVGTGKVVSGSGIALSGSGAGNYVFDAAAAQVGTAAITPKTIVATASVADKVYDGGTTATIGNVTFNGVVSGDALTSGAGSVGTFASKNVGTGKNVTGGGIVLAGADAGNYVVDAGSAIGTAAITPKTVTATASVADKVYDGTTAAAIGNVAFDGVVSGDALTSGAGSVGTFASKNVGTAKNVTGGGIVLTGADAGNYRVDAGRAIGTGAITPKVLAASGTIADKVYDGTTVARITDVTLAGVVDGDVGRVTATGTTGRHGDRNVGTGKVVTGSGLGLAGSEAGNYALDTGAAVGTGRITPKVLSADGVNVADKLYDGTAVATVGGLVLGGVVAGDEVAGHGGSGRFASPDVGTDKIVTVGALSLAGRDAGNYTLDRTVASGSASIVPLRNDAGAATALVAPPVGANGTTVLSTRTLEPVAAPVDATARATLAVLVTGRTDSPATSQSASIGNTGAATVQVREPLVLTDAVLVSRGRLSLALDNGVPAVVPLQSSVPVYSERAGQAAPKSEGQYAVTDRGTDVSLALVGTAAPRSEASVVVAPSGARTTEAAVLSADGGALALRVSLLADGTLTVLVPDSGAALSAETATAYALATAKDRFGITVQAVKAVIVRYGSSMAKVAGL